MHGSSTSGTPLSKRTCAPPTSCLRLNSTGVGPFQRMAAEPDHHHPVDDVGRLEQRRGDVADRADRHDVERIVRATGPRPGHEVVDRRRRPRRLRRADLFGHAAMNEALRRDVQPLQQAQDLLVAQLHAVAGTVRAAVVERRGVDRLRSMLSGDSSICTIANWSSISL